MTGRTRFLILVLSMAFSTRGIGQIEAESYLVADGGGAVLAKKNETEIRPIASLTKIAMALVVLERMKDDPAGEILPVPPGALVGGANPLRLKVGDRLSVDAALHAAILGSDNVSAYSLAEHFGGVEDFVKAMNELAKSLGMERTTFLNPHGLDVPGKEGGSTAADLARLAIAATRNRTFMSICGKKNSIVRVKRGGGTVEKTVSNTNEILGQSGVDGLKTGTTRRAGACFLGAAVSEEGRVICVVLNSSDRFGDARELFRIGRESLRSR